MKRFLVFAGHRHYPSGGMNDFKGDFDYLYDAKQFVILKSALEREAGDFDWVWYHIYDQEDGKIVEEGRS